MLLLLQIWEGKFLMIVPLVNIMNHALELRKKILRLSQFNFQVRVDETHFI